LEHEVLQRGVLWGLGRLAYARSELVSYAAAFLPPFLNSQDPTLRGLALWAAGALPLEKTRPFIKPLAEDRARFAFFSNGEIIEMSIGKLAADVLNRNDT
jgi:hypothetical protein